MKKLLLCAAGIILLAGCSGVLEKQQPICTGTALVGGQETGVQIYGVRKQANQTLYRAGYPFGWHWVGKNNFISTTCADPENH
jgi:hypothetical protein